MGAASLEGVGSDDSKEGREGTEFSDCGLGERGAGWIPADVPARTYAVRNSQPLVLGFSAVGGLVVVGAITFLLRRPADVWGVPHRVLGAGLFLLALHGLRRTVGTLRSPPRVVVEATGLTAYNLNTPTRHADVADIAAIKLQSMRYGRSRVSMSVPLVTTKDGSAFWLDGLAARQNAESAVIESQRTQLREIRSILKLCVDDGAQGVSKHQKPIRR